MPKNEKFELKHHKDFHGIQFQNFNIKERNLIFALCYKLMEQDQDVIEFDVKEISKISDYKPTKAGDNIYRSLEEAYKRIKNTSIRIKKENGIKHFVLFTTFETFEDKGIVKIEVNKHYRYLLNQVTAPFTIQNVIEYTGLNSGYSQLLYSFLKEWEKSKTKEFNIDEFRELLGIPKGYRISEIDKRVIAPIMLELPKYFPNLNLEKIKTGRKVTHLKFTWGSKKEKIKEVEKIEIEISEKLNKSIQKAKKNRFIEKLLNNDNIEILVNTFEENDLVRGLIWASKEIRRDISTLDYLIKTIKTGAERSEKKIVVKEAIEEIKEVLEEKMESQIVIDDQKKEIPEKIKVTQTEYEDLYQAYLKENNEKHNPYARKGFDIANRNKYEIMYLLKDDRIEIIEDTYIHYLFEEMDRLEVITEITEKELLKKMAETILNKKYVVVPFEFGNPNHMSELDDSIKRDCTLEARLRYTEKDHLNYLKNVNKTINFADLDKSLLLSKTGKVLTGGALEARLEKVARDLKKVIFYKNKIIGDMWKNY